MSLVVEPLAFEEESDREASPHIVRSRVIDRDLVEPNYLALTKANAAGVAIPTTNATTTMKTKIALVALSAEATR